MTTTGTGGDAQTHSAHAEQQRNHEYEGDQPNAAKVGNRQSERASAGAQDKAQDDRQESRVVLVDDLAAGDDYWLTITDAARVTRRQEITIRRWIAGGDLPVRRQRMGLNKRTRHVRASDLAQLTPIIDPTATITGAPANADLLSIPIQQAQLLTAQQLLAQRLAQCEQLLTTLTVQRDADRQVLAQQEEQLHAASAATATVRQDVQAEIQTLREATQEEMKELRQATTALSSLVRSLETALHDIAGQLAQERTERERGHAELAAGLTAQASALHRLEVVAQQVQSQQALLSTQQAQAEQERREWQQRLAATVEQLRDQQRMTSALSYQVTTLQQAQQDWPRQLSALQDHVAIAHADLLAQLQVERQRRRVLEQQVRLHALRALRAFRRRRVGRTHALSQSEKTAETR
ncbi:MAG: hypothetical protein ACXWQR_04950 [Ktedonobacterales bacterium]